MIENKNKLNIFLSTCLHNAVSRNTRVEPLHSAKVTNKHVNNKI